MQTLGGLEKLCATQLPLPATEDHGHFVPNSCFVAKFNITQGSADQWCL